MNVTREKLKLSRQHKKNLKNEKAFLLCPKTWCVRFDISPTDLMIFKEIHVSTWNFVAGAYTGSRVGLCAIVNASLPTVDKSLKVLCEKGFTRCEVRKVASIHGEKEINVYVSLLPKDVKPSDENIEELLEKNLVQNKVWEELNPDKVKKKKGK